MEFKCILESIYLPSGWDTLADNYFQQSGFLMHAEKYNPCQQRYYTCSDHGKLVAAAVVYSLRLDLLTFINIQSPVKMNIAGIPCSVSSQGIFGERDAIESLKKHICQVEKGFILFLNLTEVPLKGKFAFGKTMPSIILKNQWNTWDDYLAGLRSSYRRRLKMMNREESGLRFEKRECAGFTTGMYQQYLDVYRRSEGKLEKLAIDFFRNLPPEFSLTVCMINDSVIGWNIALSNQGVYYFFLGGIDYKLNKIHNTYLRLLSMLVKEGIERGSKLIELGQTAEIPKMRMGGEPEYRYMEAYHRNALINNSLKLFSRLLEYRRNLENAHVMKGGQI